MGWLPVWGPSIAAVIVSFVMGAGFTLWSSGHNERQHRKGVRELVKLEVKHNEAVLVDFRTEIAYIRRNAGEFGTTLGTKSQAPKWKRTRWDMPDVGAAFSPHEIKQIDIWYYNLDALSRNYEQLVSTVREYEASGEHAEMAAKVLADKLEPISSAAERACNLCPFPL